MVAVFVRTPTILVGPSLLFRLYWSFKVHVEKPENHSIRHSDKGLV